MKRSGNILVFLPALAGVLLAASLASAQGFGTGPINDPKTGNTSMSGGGFNPATGRFSRFETTHNPFTGKVERRSITGNQLSPRVDERIETYDPKTGTTTVRSVQRDTWTGQQIQAQGTRNIFTGERSQAIGTTNPFTGQTQGSSRRSQVDPMTGTVRTDIGLFNSWQGGMGTNYTNSYFYNPYTGGFVRSAPGAAVGTPLMNGMR